MRTARGKPYHGTWPKCSASTPKKPSVSSFTKSQSRPFSQPSSIRDTSTSIWSMHNKLAVCSTAWWASNCHPYCGAKCARVSRQAVYKVWPCDSSLSVNAKYNSSSPKRATASQHFLMFPTTKDTPPHCVPNSTNGSAARSRPRLSSSHASRPTTPSTASASALPSAHRHPHLPRPHCNKRPHANSVSPLP